MESVKQGKAGGLLMSKVGVADEDEREFDLEGQMTGGVGNDVEAEAEDNFEGEGKLSLTKDDLSLGGKLVGRFSTHIELVNSAEELFEVCNKVFGFTLKLANSVQSSAAIK
jgi:hypothetical protein